MSAALDAEDFSTACGDLIAAADELNKAAARVRAFGLQVSLYVNGHEYGDRVGVRIEGDLVDAYVKPEPPPV